MADLAAVARIKLIQKTKESDTLPVAASTGPGVPCYVDTAGKAAIGDASVAGTAAVIGINRSEKTTVANMPAELLRAGKVALYDANGDNILDGLAYGALVYLSDTAGRLADAAGTVSVVIGRVIPLWDGTTPTKILDFDLR